MLELREIRKSYKVGDTVTQALKGVSIALRDSEFVAILGPSGCGKTTLLNIIGGLDRYDSGELIINGVSTRRYRDSDWDAYRNHSIGFVFQSYNLIPHQTVLANVELALTLSGVSKSERKKRAMEALEKVGIGDQAKKKPNQLSGGQMQRVAIARALVNDPAILLADEPTGALDSTTSVQIMEILKEVAADRLVIMVTHNPELAADYATRTISLRDGTIMSDSDAYTPEQSTEEETNKRARKKAGAKHKKMSLFTAISLSLNNLLTKKARTILTSFAGSIGIIGIALILSLKSGFEAYINKVQEDTLSTYPITVQDETMDFTSLLEELTDATGDSVEEHELDKVYSRPVFGKLINAMLAGIESNDLKSFREYIESNRDELDQYTTDIKYSYGVKLDVFAETENGLVKVNPMDAFSAFTGRGSANGAGFGGNFMTGNANGTNVWSELLDNRELLESQYDTVYGRWPEKYNEVVLFVNDNNEISDYILCALGLADQNKVAKMLTEAIAGEKIANEVMKSYSYEEICDIKFRLIPSSLMYRYDEATGVWENRENDTSYMKWLAENSGEELRIVGIMRPSSTATATSATGRIGYTHALTEFCIGINNQSDIVKQQKSTEKNEIASALYGGDYRYCDIDVFTGIPFGYEAVEKEVTIEDVYAYIATLPAEQQEQIKAMIANMPEDEIIANFGQALNPTSQTTKATLESNLSELGAAELDTPTTISFYAKDFESKDKLGQFISDYNAKAESDGKPEKVIRYTDFIGLFLSSVSTIIDAISYVLIAFVAISLVVSSIMIGVITYISVLERTKEIGILRSIGASRRDISRVFNAETLIVGFVSGMIGILLTLLLNIPINLVIYSLTDISNVAQLPLVGGIILVAISMLLTFIAGLIPSGLAARKDPVVALRTE